MPQPKNLLSPSVHVVILTTFAALIWAHWPGWASLLETWGSDPDYNHGYLVVPISIWLLWQRRDRLSSVDFSPSWWGIVLIIVAGMVRWVGAEFFLAEFDTWSIPIWIAGVVLLFGGWSLLKWSAGSIAFLWFMTPLPANLTMALSLPLQKLSGVFSTWTLQLFAQPAIRQGTTILIGEQILEVERACSGLRICYGIMALAVAYVVLIRPRVLRATVLILAAIPVAVIANSARVTATGLLFQVVSGEKAHEYVHDFAGLLMLPFAVGLFWLIHMAMEKVIAVYGRSAKAGNLLLLKIAVVGSVVVSGLIFWQREQADVAVGTLLKIAERYEETAEHSQSKGDLKKAFKNWVDAASALDRYCRVRSDDAIAAEKLAKAVERIAVSKPGLVRAARYYKRAWLLQPDDNELGFKHTRLALAGDEFATAVAGAEKLLQQTDPADSQYLEAFQLKVRAQFQDAVQLNSNTTWTQVTVTLKEGIAKQLDPVVFTGLLAVVYRQHNVDAIDETQRKTAAEQVFAELLANRPDDPMAWFARYTYGRMFPSTGISPATIPAANDDGDPNADPEPRLDSTSETNNTDPSNSVVRVSPPNADADLKQAIKLASTKKTTETYPVWLAAGELAIDQKQFVQARQYFSTAVQINPTESNAYFQLARLETQENIDGRGEQKVTQEQRNAAVAILKQGLSVDGIRNRLVLQMELVRQQLQSRDAEHVSDAQQGIADLNSVFRTMPPETGVPLAVELTILESQFYEDTGDLAKASQILESMLNSDEIKGISDANGSLSNAWLALGNTYELQGLTNKADACLRRGTELAPDSIQTAIVQASKAEQASNTSAAADLYEDIATRLGNRYEPWLGLAMNELRRQLAISVSRRDFTRFDMAMARAKSLGAPVAETALIEAEYRSSIGDIQEALAVLERAASGSPGSSQVWHNLAIVRQSLGDTSGAKTALTHYLETTDDSLRGVLLESELLIRIEDWDKARQVLSEALQAAADSEDQRRLHQQLVRIAMINKQTEVVQELLEGFIQQHPDDVPSLIQLGDFYWSERQFGLMETLEEHVRKLDGEDGTFWKEMRVQRLIELVRRSVEKTERDVMLSEIKTLAGTLESSTTNRPRTQVLLGRLAVLEQRFDDASRHFKKAWDAGDRSPLLGIELITALQATGNSSQIEVYLDQMQSLLDKSPQLFDLALATRSKGILDDTERASQIAGAWVQSIGDADSYLRLARVLQLQNVPSEAQRTTHSQNIEQAYRKAIELNSGNPQAWGEFFRFLYLNRNEPDRMVSELNLFIRNEGIPELDRSFVTSQLLTEFQYQQQATRYWNATIELASDNVDKETQIRVLTLAAMYFAKRDLTKAAALARQAVSLDPTSAENLRLLIAILYDTNTEASIDEAYTLIDALQATSNPLTIADKRIVAMVSYRRTVLFPSNNDVADNLRQASQMLNSVGQSNETDDILLARIIAAQGDKKAALLALSDVARRSNASATSIRAFVEFWQDHFREENFLIDRIEQALQSLEKTAGSEVVALELRLRPTSLSRDEIFNIVRQFVARVVVPLQSESLQNSLLQQISLLLARVNQQDTGLKIASDDETALSSARMLSSILIATIQTPGTLEFEKSLNELLATQLDKLDNARLDRIAADYYFMRAKWEEAEKCYRRCLQRDTDDVAAMNNLALVVAERRGDLADAERLVQDGLKILAKKNTPAGGNSFLLDTQSLLKLASGETEQAFAILTPLAESVIADSSVLLHFAECLRRMGNSEESRKAFVIAQQLGIAVSQLPPMDKRIHDDLAAASAKHAEL